MNKSIIIAIAFSTVLVGQGWYQSQVAGRQFNQAVEQYNQGRYAVSEAILRKLLKKDLDSFSSSGAMLLMKSVAAQKRNEEAQKIGRDFLTRFPSSKYVKDITLTFGDIFINEGLFSSAFRSYLSARSLGNDPGFLDQADLRLMKTIGLDLDELVLLELNATETSAGNRMILYLALALEQIRSGNPDAAASSLAQIDPGFVPGAFMDIYESLLLASYRPGERVFTVGVVASLTGAHNDDGRMFVSGLKKAVEENITLGSNINLVILDNHSDELGTVKAIQQLSGQSNVSAIIGPIEPKHALLAASSVGGSQTPMILPGEVDENLTMVSEQVFQLRSDLITQGKLAAKYALQVLGLDSLAVIAPADEFGQTLTDAFVQEVDSQGRTIVAVEWYTGVPENISNQFKNLRKTAFMLLPAEKTDTNIFGLEIDSLDALFDISIDGFFDIPEEKDEVRLTKADSADIELGTIQGLYLPIHPGHLEYVATQFPVYNLDTRVIGNEGWLDPEMLGQENIGPHLEGLSVLTYRTHINDGGRDEHFSLGFDLGRLLQSVVSQKGDGQNPFRDYFANVDQFHGDFSFFSFIDDSRINSGLHVMEFSGNSFKSQGFLIGDSLVFVAAEAP